MTKNFDTSSKEDKIFELNVRYYSNGLSKGQTKTGIYKFLITSIRTNDETKTAICKAKCQDVDKNGYRFPKSMFKPKRITLTIMTTSNEIGITIKSKQGVLTEVTKKISSSSSGIDGDGCYITTACISSKNMPDNCYELETLRYLRDQYMKNNNEGKKLIEGYYSLAPSLVNQINTFDNKEEIYDHIYKKNDSTCSFIGIIGTV